MQWNPSLVGIVPSMSTIERFHFKTVNTETKYHVSAPLLLLTLYVQFNTILRILAAEHPELAGRGTFIASANRYNIIMLNYVNHILWEIVNSRYLYRLDRQTSGLLLLARNHRTAARFSNSLMKRSMRKEYLARVKVRFNGWVYGVLFALPLGSGLPPAFLV